jgi:hypothetical protein
VTSRRPRHEASKIDPTVHGSWLKEFLFYSTSDRAKHH